MKIVRYETADGASAYGAIVDREVYAVAGDPGVSPSIGDRIGFVEDVGLLAPCLPTKIICVGRNYVPHIQEMGEPMPEEPFIFLKAPNTVVGPGAPIQRPSVAQRFDYEAELAVVMGKRARNLTEGTWRDHVLGYTCGNDVTVRDWQDGGQWVRAKSADTFCPLGPWVLTDLDNPDDVGLQARLNGEVRQEARTSECLFSIAELLMFITEWVTLEAGDVVLTGTPGGVGPMVPGDVVEVEIQGIGVLRNEVR